MLIGSVLPCWPMGPVVRGNVLEGLVIIAGVVFSLVMLIDCLKRHPERFVNPLTKNGEYDKLIWAAAIILSFGFYFLGAIVYFFVVKKAKPKSEE